ncbi:MAG: hypothetical protein ABIH66_04750 [bacterium]
MRKTIASLFCVALLLAAAGASAMTPREVWNSLDGKLKKAKDLSAEIGFFMYYPDSILKYYPDAREELKYNVGGWRYQNLNYVWKAPDLVYITLIKGRNLGNDLALTIAEENPGTRIVYGLEDEIIGTSNDFIYSRFPVTKKTKALFPEVETTVFAMPVGNAKFSSAITGMGYHTTPAELILNRVRYFDIGTVTVEDSKYVLKENFKVKKGEVMYKEEEVPGGFYLMTLKPKDAEKNRGISKELIYFDKKTLLPLQIEMYHNDTMAVCMTIKKLKIDSGVDGKLWTDFFEGAKIVGADNAPPK